MDPLTSLVLSKTTLLDPLSKNPILKTQGIDLHPGHLYGVVGTNLSGRSAFLRYLGGGHLPVHHESQSPSPFMNVGLNTRVKLQTKLHSAYLGPSPYDSISSLTSTVDEEFRLHRQGWDSDEHIDVRDRLDEWIKVFNLSSLLSRDPLKLSGGQTASVALLSSLMLGRVLLCIDDALSQLDAPKRASAWELLKAYAQAGGIVLVADNHYDLMAKKADYLVLIKENEIEAKTIGVMQGFGRPDVVSQKTVPQRLPRSNFAWYEQTKAQEGATGFIPVHSENNLSADLHFENLVFRYPHTEGNPALQGASGYFPSGSIVGLLGCNGAGKSTLCKILNGVLPCDQGVISIAGHPVTPYDEPGQHVAYSFQNPDHQLFLSTVAGELTFGPRNVGMEEGDIRSSVEAALKSFGLEDVIDAHPLDLPLVLRKRVAMASAIAMRRPWVVLDEPTLGQDPGYCESLVEVVSQLATTGRGAIIISHDHEFLLRICDRVLVLINGKTAWEGDKENFLSSLPLDGLHEFDLLGDS